MDPRKLFFDERLAGFCVYCGKDSETRDHVPSKVLLDEPYSFTLPVVGACRACNEGFSIDEEYFACLIECSRMGTINPDNIERHKIKNILIKRPFLATKIEKSRIIDDKGNVFWKGETARFENIILKHARGHLAFERNIFHFEDPDFLECVPIGTMSEEEFSRFNSVPQSYIIPELGSRASQHILIEDQTPATVFQYWKLVQAGRYRYLTDQTSGSDLVKFVFSEYLACTVRWN